MNTYWGSEGIAPRIIDVGTRWEWSASRPGRSNPGEKNPGYPFYRRLAGAKTRRWGEKFLAPTGIRTPNYPGVLYTDCKSLALVIGKQALK
jgi:hypothetical protein